MQHPRESGGPPPPIAIRQAFEDGWRGFARAPATLMLFTLLVGSLNLCFQLLIRWSADVMVDPFGQPDPLPTTIQILAWVGYGLSGLWLVAGLLLGAEGALLHRPVPLRRLLHVNLSSLVRTAGSLALVALMVALTTQLAQASAWLLALLQPTLIALPLLAGVVAVVYLVADQILCLPISVLGKLNPALAIIRSRAAIDANWLQALGLTLLLILLVLAGILMLFIGLTATLPLAACTLVAAYRQLFAPSPSTAQSPADQQR